MEYRDLKKQYQVLKKDIDAAMEEVITTAQFISGPQVKALENELAEYTGAKHCITCANGTDALSLALMAWGVGNGDAVFVPDFTYFSSGEVVAFAGATPFFVDIDKYTYNMSAESLEKVILEVQSEGKYNPKVVVAVDLFGLLADYDSIRQVCNKYGLFLLEDAAQGFGGKLHDRKACTFGDISTTSFFPAKPVGCYGDGGAVFTDNDDWAALIRSYAVHGKGSSKYDNVRIGMNSRLDTLQAAILQVKLRAFREYELEKINAIAKKYEMALEHTTLQLPVIQKDYCSSWAQYTIQLPEGISRQAVQEEMKKNGVPSMIYYINPMHLQKAFLGTISANAECPVTERLCRTVLSLPIDPYKTDSEIKFIAETVEKAIR